jgi:hypothetical protein
MNKVIYISIYPLTEQIMRYLLIRDMIDAEIEVEFWDLSEVYYKDFIFQNIITCEWNKKIGSLREIKSFLKNEDLKNTVFVTQVNLNWQTLSLYFVLTRFNCKMIYFALVSSGSSGLLIRKVIESIKGSSFFACITGRAGDMLALICKKNGLDKGVRAYFCIRKSDRK